MPYSSEVLADSPWGFWEQTETSGTALADASGNSRSLTISGSAATLAQQGPSVSVPSISWAAAAGSAGTSASITTSPVTVEAWVYLTATPGTHTTVFGCQQTANSLNHDKQLSVNTAGQAVFFYYSGAGNTLTASAALSLNTWHHLIGSVGAAGGKLRVDKVTVATAAATTSWTDQAQQVHTRRGGDGSFIVNDGTAAMRVATPAIYTTQLSDARTDAHYDAMFALIDASGESDATATATVADGPLTVTLSGSGESDATATARVYTIWGTELANKSNGRPRTGQGVMVADPPVVATPANLVRGHDYDKAIALPTPVLDGGRVT